MGGQGGPSRRERGGAGGGVRHLLGWLTLVALAFVAGLAISRVEGDTGGARQIGRLPDGQVAVPATPTAVPSTPEAPPTPTPTSPEAGDILPTLYIEIAPRDFAEIEAKREEALETWILQSSRDDFVPATVRLGDDDPVRVRLRLKGDWGDHFAHDKWSYRIEVRGGMP